MRLSGKIAIITGSGRGIGQAIATTFAEQGARLVIADVDLTHAERTADGIQRDGGDAMPVRVDVADPTQVDGLIDATLERYGRIDVLVNNAGVGLNKPFLATTLQDLERQLRVNLIGTFLCGQCAARVMVEQSAGSIVNMASISGQRGAQGRAAYGAAKAGVIQLTKVMALELADKGVRVNAVAPGPVDTDQSRGTHTEATRRSYLDRIPLRRYGQRAEVAAAVLFLASDEAGFVIGHVLNADGGFRAAGLMFDEE